MQPEQINWLAYGGAVLVVLGSALTALGPSLLAGWRARKARLAAMDEAGDKGATAALKLLEEPTQFLSTVQVGITSIGMLNGIVGEAAFSDDLSAWIRGFGVADGTARDARIDRARVHSL